MFMRVPLTFARVLSRKRHLASLETCLTGFPQLRPNQAPRYPKLRTRELELHAATASADGQQIAGSVLSVRSPSNIQPLLRARVVSILTTQSTFLKTNLTTTKTAYSLANEKEPQLAHLKTKHGRLLVGDLQPCAQAVTIKTIIWVLVYACAGPSTRLLYPHLPGRAQAGEGLHVLLLGPELGGGLGREDWAEGVRDRGLLHLRRHEGTPTVHRDDRSNS